MHTRVRARASGACVQRSRHARMHAHARNACCVAGTAGASWGDRNQQKEQPVRERVRAGRLRRAADGARQAWWPVRRIRAEQVCAVRVRGWCARALSQRRPADTIRGARPVRLDAVGGVGAGAPARRHVTPSTQSCLIWRCDLPPGTSAVTWSRVRHMHAGTR